MTEHKHLCTHEHPHHGHHHNEQSAVKVDTHEGAAIGSYRFEVTG